MKPRTVVTLSGSLGFIVGAIAYGSLAARSIGVQTRAVQQMYSIEQEFLAKRAERNGDLLAALHHQWNVVDASSDNWIHTYQHWETPPPWFALQWLELGEMQRSRPVRGKEIADGLGRGSFARLLDANGFETKATEQWKQAAQETTRGDEARIRALVTGLAAQLNSDLEQSAERAVLGPE